MSNGSRITGSLLTRVNQCRPNKPVAPKVILGQQKCLYVIHSESFLSAFPQDKGNLRRYRYSEQARLLLLRYSSPVQSAPFPEGECISTQALVFAQPC